MQQLRTKMLIGEQSVQKLNNSHVAVFGLGGVGSYTVEALARAGVGKLTIVDCDVVDITNVNRQLIALHSTVGMPKTQVAKSRILDINPNCKVFDYNLRFDSATQKNFDFSQFDYVVDAIDTVTSKLLLVELCNANNVPIISSMGTGNKLDATAFEVADISQTSVCPLCKVMRKELKRRNLHSLRVVYSKEEPQKPLFDEQPSQRRQTPASISFVPSVAGLILAGEVIKDLIASK